MDILEILRDYQEAVFDTDGERALALIDQAYESGVSAEDIVFRIVIPTIEKMMAAINRDPDANLAQHFMTAQIAATATERMLSRFRQPPASQGTVVIGTAAGDLHSLGKRIVSGCLKSLMIEVIDAGVNVAPARFVEAAVEHGAQVIAISSMMVHTARGDNGCLGVRRLLQERGLEDRIRLVVGGAPYRFDGELYRTVQADAWAEDGITAGRVILDLIHEVERS